MRKKHQELRNLTKSLHEHRRKQLDALVQIRDSRTYREEYATFAEFVEKAIIPDMRKELERISENTARIVISRLLADLGLEIKGDGIKEGHHRFKVIQK